MKNLNNKPQFIFIGIITVAFVCIGGIFGYQAIFTEDSNDTTELESSSVSEITITEYAEDNSISIFQHPDFRDLQLPIKSDMEYEIEYISPNSLTNYTDIVNNSDEQIIDYIEFTNGSETITVDFEIQNNDSITDTYYCRKNGESTTYSKGKVFIISQNDLSSVLSPERVAYKGTSEYDEIINTKDPILLKAEKTEDVDICLKPQFGMLQTTNIKEYYTGNFSYSLAGLNDEIEKYEELLKV